MKITTCKHLRKFFSDFQENNCFRKECVLLSLLLYEIITRHYSQICRVHYTFFHLSYLQAFQKFKPIVKFHLKPDSGKKVCSKFWYKIFQEVHFCFIFSSLDINFCAPDCYRQNAGLKDKTQLNHKSYSISRKTITSAKCLFIKGYQQSQITTEREEEVDTLQN